MPIIRDKHAIVIQHSKGEIAFSGESKYQDGGDSAARTGILALSMGLDQENLKKFLFQNGLVRHPFQFDWKDPKKTSRDQVGQACVSDCEASREIAAFYCDKVFINKDICMPDFRMSLYRRAKKKPTLFVALTWLPFMWLSLLWNTKIKPLEEMNQFMCQCYRLGGYWTSLFLHLHPDVEKSLRDYWGGWRDQIEIGEILYGSSLQQAEDYYCKG